MYTKDMGKLVRCNDRLKGYGASEPLPVSAKFRTTLTTQKGAKTEAWVYLVDGDEDMQALLGDEEATALGFLTFSPEGRDPNSNELKINKISEQVQIGRGSMPDTQHIPEIDDKEVQECEKIVNDPKYATIFDGHIGKMHNRKPIVLQGNDKVRVKSQPYRPIPLQFQEEISAHLETLRKNNKIVDVDPNVECVDICCNVEVSRKPSGKLRMNIDARPINAATADVVTPHMKTPEDVRHKLAGSTRYSEFDMNHGYNQSTLSEESSKMSSKLTKGSIASLGCNSDTSNHLKCSTRMWKTHSGALQEQNMLQTICWSMELRVMITRKT